MGWFGSLDLAYKYALKKYVKKTNLEATGAQEERVELNKRELDEGDLFGIRAIQSGFFGGVAQSRPSSLAESNSPEGSSSNTLLGSHASPKLTSQSPMSSVTTLPLEARRSSPLAHNSLSSEDLNAHTTPKKRVPTPLRSTLAPSDAELSGRASHDPAVNMSLEIPPSPLANSRQSTTYLDTHDRTPSGYFSSPHNGGKYAPLGAPQMPEPRNKVIIHNQHQLQAEQPIRIPQMVHDPLYRRITILLRFLRGEHFMRDKVPTVPTKDQGTEIGTNGQEQREVTRQGQAADTVISRKCQQSTRKKMKVSSMLNPTLSHPTYSRASALASNRPDAPGAVGDWGPDIFKEIDKSLQESQSISATSTQYRYNHHTSTLSDGSSIHKPIHGGHLSSDRQTSIDSTSEPRQSVGPEIVLESNGLSPEQDSRRRESDASSRELMSSEQSNAGSHRNTKELGDFYDSYWRRSGQAQVVGHSGNQNSRLIGDGRRPAQMELRPEPIAEVPSPFPSPSIGKAI
ncbi:MAG: hypothetical protein Q9219_006707 [cf. Caloplaca sp. 3 TL-2023]